MKKGQALIEILVVVVVIAVICGIAIPLARIKSSSAKYLKEENKELILNDERRVYSSGYIGKVNVDGINCIYFRGGNGGGISCDWQSNKYNPVGLIGGKQ